MLGKRSNTVVILIIAVIMVVIIFVSLFLFSVWVNSDVTQTLTASNLPEHYVEVKF